MSGSFEVAIRELARSLLQLLDQVADPAGVERLLARLGWQPPPGVDLVKAFAVDASHLPDLVVAVMDDPEPDLGRYLELTAGVARTLGSLSAAAAQLPSELAANADYLAKTDIEHELFPRLLDELLLERIETGPPLLVASLRLLGIVRRESHELDDASYQTRHDRAVIKYQRLAELLTAPNRALADEYGWGAAGFQVDRLLAALGGVLQGLGVRAVVDGAGTLLIEAADVGATSGLGASLRRLASGDDDPDAGLELRPLAAAARVPLPLTDTLALELVTDLDPSAAISLQMQPSGARLRIGGASDITGGISLTLRATGRPDQTYALLTLPGGVGLRARELIAEVGIRFAAGKVDGGIGVGVAGGQLSVAVGSDDGFLAHALPSSLSSTFDAVLRWSARGGLQLEGSAALDVSVPLDTALGPLVLKRLRLTIRPAPEAIAVTGGLDATLHLGPFTATVADIGIQGDLHFREGNLGRLALGVGFKPPSGVGLAIKTPAVSGGGFLELDYEAGRYSGVFELTIVKTVSVKVIGIITTKLPDGSPGFALLLIITAEGFTPIQLGMGFVLTGIGGLIALNRTIDVEAVRGGLSSGVLDSVLFAKDPVANADRIIATLETIFPLAPDRLLIGPLAEIGWGSPPVVKVRLALLLEIPQPVRVVLLAALALALPDEDAPVVEIHVDAIGLLDLGRGELALDASLHHSRLWKFALTGDLALRLNWGDDPTFLLSVGGFHPAFTPPAGLRRLERLTFSLSDSENPRIRFETYLAVTSNTIQLGARVSVLFESGGFGVDGGGAFDALVQWVPFGLDVRFEAWIRIFSPAGTLCAARLALQVTGPQPWHVVGVASLQVLMFQVQVAVDFHVGDPLEPVTVESVDVVELLWDELSRPGGWTAALPSGRTSGATLGGIAADPAAAGQPLLVHPLDALSVRQKVVPLGTRVTRIGALRPKRGPGSYDLDVESPTGIVAAPLRDRFAAAQFTDLTEDEKLSAPSFVSWPAGLSFAPSTGDGLPTGRSMTSELEFETLDVTSLEEPAVATGGSAPGIPEELLAPASPTNWSGLAVVHR